MTTPQTKESIKNMIIIEKNGNLQYMSPKQLNKEQESVLYHAVSVFHFLAFLHSITFAELANKIKESYSLETPQNKACYDVLLLADSLTING